jgi:Short C-terminal domain
MLGNKNKLIQELQESGGKVAWATVLQAADQWRSSTSSFSSYNVTDHVKVTLRVEPDGEPPFETTFHQAFPGTVPMQGWQCKVIFDPSDHERIAVLSDQIFPPGIDHDRAERAAAMHDQIQEALKSGDMAGYIEQIKSQAMSGALHGVRIADGRMISGAGAPQPDPVDQLSKLAELHDKGALTDAEFTAMKAKILGSE